MHPPTVYSAVVLKKFTLWVAPIMYNFIIFYRFYFPSLCTSPYQQLPIAIASCSLFCYYNHPLHAQYFLFYFNLEMALVNLDFFNISYS